MATPKEILAVARPKNTVVVTYGKEKNLYAVRQRVGCRRVNGCNIPVTGPTIGHIRDGKYVALTNEKPKAAPLGTSVDLRDWADVALCDRIFSDMLPELEEVYRPEDALKFYCIAILRVCNPGIKDCELSEYYANSFLSILRPDVALSKNTVSTFHKNAGKSLSMIVRFMRKRAAKVGRNDHVLVDGTLKANTSTVNSLSDFSRKAKVRGACDISVLYAFNLEKMEPVCSKCFPGNMLDLTAYEAFLREDEVTAGILVGDKGFPSSAIEGHLSENVALHHINPIKRNARFIETHDMLKFGGKLPGYGGVVFKKVRCKGGKKFLYSFRDVRMAANEEHNYLEHVKAKDYDAEAYEATRETFGTIVLESDLDLPPEVVYRAYEERWQIELVMRYYKSACEFDETRVHSDYSVIGSEFCDFLATILTWRLIKEFTETGLLNETTYRRIMKNLKRAKKAKVGEEDWQLIKVNPSIERMLASLGLGTLATTETSVEK